MDVMLKKYCKILKSMKTIQNKELFLINVLYMRHVIWLHAQLLPFVIIKGNMFEYNPQQSYITICKNNEKYLY